MSEHENTPPVDEAPVAWDWVARFVHDVHKTGRAMAKDFENDRYNTDHDYENDIEASEAHFVARLRGSLEALTHPPRVRAVEEGKSGVRDVLWALAQGVREAIRDDSGPREESIALSFVVEKLINKAEAALTTPTPEDA